MSRTAIAMNPDHVAEACMAMVKSIDGERNEKIAAEVARVKRARKRFPRILFSWAFLSDEALRKELAKFPQINKLYGEQRSVCIQLAKMATYAKTNLTAVWIQISLDDFKYFERELTHEAVWGSGKGG